MKMTISDKITADVAYEQDVRTMSYDQLMETIRFLDQEREDIKKSVEKKSRRHYFPSNQDIIKRVA